MDLWIRSQDKTTLIKSYEIYISEQPNTYLIRAKRTSHILGSYSTIERALEVLDEIQKFLENNYETYIQQHDNGLISVVPVYHSRKTVFEMPKE